MRRPTLLTSLPLAAWLVLGAGLGGQAGQIDVPSAVELLAQGSSERVEYGADPVSAMSPWHEAEAMGAAGKDGKSERIDRPPPQPIVERPGAGTPSPDARWIEGYWTWNERRKDFDWVTGVWRVAPAGKFWVSGYWRRDPTGWSRVPGFWSEGRATMAAKREAASAPAERSSTKPPPERPREFVGSLPERPREIIGPPPGPAYFYIPGEYAPQGSQLAWKPGIWYPSQPGWEWIPAHWVRQATGWTYREGYWNPFRRSPSQTPGNGSALGGATSVAAAGSDRSGPDTTANRVMPVSSVAPARDDPSRTGGTATEASGSEVSANALGNGDAGSEALAAEKKPSESAAPAAIAVRSAPRPAYNNSWGGMQWNGRAPSGGMFGRFLPY